MKRFFYLCLVGTLLCVKPQTVFAQKTGLANPPFSKASWQLGLKDGWGASPLLGNRNTAQMTVGYYVVKQLLIGLAGTYLRELAEPVITKNLFSAGPLVRYQFISGRISPYAELSYQFGRQNTNVNQSLLVTPGISIGLVAGLRVDLSYCFQYYSSFEQYGQPQVGLNYVFNKNQ